MRAPFRAKLMAVVATAALALVVIVVTSELAARKNDRHIAQIRRLYLPKVGLQPKLLGEFERLQRSFQDAVSAGDAEMLPRTRELKKALLDEIGASAGALDPARALVLTQAIDDYYATAYAVSQRLIGGEAGEMLVAKVGEMQAKQARVSELINFATAFDKEGLTRAFRAADRAATIASRTRLAVAAACLVVVVALSLWISRGVLRSLAGLTAGFKRFGEGDFAVPIPPASQDELGDLALQANSMARSLERLGAERNRIDWLKAGHAGLAQELRGEQAPRDVANRAISFLAGYLDAPIGVLYYADGAGALRLLGGHALAQGSDAPPESIQPGEGVVGQAALQPDVTVVNFPSGELRVRSGLVDGTPRGLVLLPLVHNGRVKGVLELAVLRRWTERDGELLLSVRETLTIALEVARSRDELREQNAALVEARRRLEQKAGELTVASTYKSQFLANMSHELRTPLNAIIGFAELLLDGAISPESAQHKEFLGDILTSGRHLLQLINDVLDLSKVEAGKLEFRPENIRLSQVVGEVLAILRTTSASKQIVIESRLEPAVDELFLDGARLKQVLYNYLSNAIKFTPEGGRVIVRASAEGPACFRIEVEDTGIGISVDDLPRLFGEFQQLGDRGAKRPAGTGLGLALTKRLVEAQGGTVGVTSRLGQGSVFHAVLPRRVADSPALRPATRGSLRPGAPAILVVEDDARDQARLVEALAGAGYSVSVATTGAEATRLCRDFSFEAITLDLLLPDVTGLEVLRQIRTGKNARAPVFVITVVAEGGATGGQPVTEILRKPIDRTALLDALARAGVSAEPAPQAPQVKEG